MFQTSLIPNELVTVLVDLCQEVEVDGGTGHVREQ